MSLFSKLKQARELLNLSQTDAADLSGLDQRDISQLEGGRRKFVPNSYIQFLHKNGIDVNSIFDDSDKKARLIRTYTPADEESFQGNYVAERQITPHRNKANASRNASPTASPTTEKREKSIDLIPLVITVDNSGKENILYVPVQARAGYLTGHSDPNFLQTLPAFAIPGLHNGTYRMFDVTGVSMAPTIADGDRVIAEYISSFDDIKEGRVYVVVTNAGIVVKRVLNRIHQRGKLVLRSDTIAHRLEFKTYEINYEDVIEMWYCRMKLSADFSEPAEIYTKLNDLESDVVELKTINNNLLFDMEEIKQIVYSKFK